MLANVAASALIVLAAVLAGLGGTVPDDRRLFVLAIATQYLGAGLALLAGQRVIPAVAALVVAAGVVAILWPADAPRARSPRDLLPPRLPWLDLSGVALTVVGAIALASARPLLGGPPDATIDLLALTGLLCCLLGEGKASGGQVACGLFFVLSAGNALLHLAEPALAPGATVLLAAMPLALALALARSLGALVEDPGEAAP